MTYSMIYIIHFITALIYLFPLWYAFRFAKRKFKEKKYVKSVLSILGGVIVTAILKGVLTTVVRAFILSHGVH